MNKLLQTLPLAAGLLAAASLSGQTLVSDDFTLRGSLADGDILDGVPVQFSSSGSPAYISSNGLASTMRFNVRGSDTIAVPNYVNDAPNSALGFEIVDMPSTGIVRFEAVALPTGTFPGAVAGMWVGLTGAPEPALQNNIGTATEHVTARLITSGGRIGSLNLQTYDGVSEANSFSPAPDAVTFNTAHEYLLSMEYNFDTQLATATVENLTAGGSTSTSITLSDPLAVSYGQMDITGQGPDQAPGDLAGFSSYTVVVPEPTTYALLGGILALGVAFLRRRRS